jgi:hypothetical protein
MGVAIGALAVETSVHFKHGVTPTAEDFSTAFLFVGGFAALSALLFVRLPPDAGAELANRTPVPTDPTDQRTG